MSKFILTGDMPSNCSECPYYDLHLMALGNIYPDKVCKAKSIIDNGNTIYWLLNCDVYNKKSPQCPLQDTTELLEAVEFIVATSMFESKYTTEAIECITKIKQALGGTNDENKN